MEKNIFIKNRKGKRLAAIFHTPEKATNKIVIITHSFKGDKDYQPILRNFSRKAEAEGFAALRFDCYGSGESEGTYEESSITTQVEDLEDIIKFIKSKGYENICLAGISQGTTISVLAYDDSIKCLLLWSPVFEHKHLYENYKEEFLKYGYIIRERNLTGEKVKVGKKMWEEFRTINTKEKLKDIHSPTLAIVGTEDNHITIEKAESFMALMPCEHKLEVIEGGDHDYLIKEAEEKAISISIEFITNNL